MVTLDLMSHGDLVRKLARLIEGAFAERDYPGDERIADSDSTGTKQTPWAMRSSER
jgi:hypothetical protein